MIAAIRAWLAQRAASAAATRLASPRRLKQYTLGATSGSVRVAGWPTAGASLVIAHDPAFDGVEIRGLGMELTTVTEDAWDELAIGIGRFSGTVRLVDMTVVGGLQKIPTIACGGEWRNDAPRALVPFRVELERVHLKAGKPGADGKRTTWGLSGYNVDILARGCTFDFTAANEHSVYLRGAAQHGWMFERCHFVGSGAEGLKVRADSHDSAWVGPKVWLIVRECDFQNWTQPHSWRGGAGMVVQGGACNILVERCVFQGGGDLAQFKANERSHCLMVSSEAISYDIDTGAQDVGHGNGWVIVRDSAFAGSSAVTWHNDLLRVGRNSGTQHAAKGVLIQGCGLYGPGVIVSISSVPTGKVRISGCNTPAIAAYCKTLGIDTAHEAMVHSGGRLQPVSKGFSW